MKILSLLGEVLGRTNSPPAAQKKIEESLRKALSAAVVVMPLNEAQNLGGAAVAALAQHIDVMSQPDLKKLLKLWDPHRKFPRDTTITELRSVATALLNAESLPVKKLPPAPRKRRD